MVDRHIAYLIRTDKGVTWICSCGEIHNIESTLPSEVDMAMAKVRLREHAEKNHRGAFGYFYKASGDTLYDAGRYVPSILSITPAAEEE